MHRNKFWLSFLIIVSGIILWFAAMAALQVRYYLQLSGSSPAHIERFWAQEVGADAFEIWAKYTYRVDDKEYRDTDALSRLGFRNRFAAEAAVEEMEDKTWIAWYKPSDPSKSELDKLFPVKDVFYAVLLIIVGIYLWWLGFHVGKRSKKL